MKNSKKIKLILIILICILFILAGMFGIYVKKGNSYKNLLPDYKLASDFKGSTTLELEVDRTKETVYYNNEGKKVDSSEVTEDNKADYTLKEESVNQEEDLTTQNYEKVVKIMEKRLKFLKADQYRIDLDKNSGKIILTIDDEYMSDIKSILPMEGKLELIDSNTEDIIIDYTDFKSAESTYASLDEGYVTYINLQLNDSGMEKIKNIEKYKAAVVENDNGEKVENTFKIMFDDENISEVSYENILLNGKTLRITTANNLTSSSEVQSRVNMDGVVAKLANIGKLPVVYKINVEEYVKTQINIKNIMLVTIVACLIISIIFIIRYKVKGILAVLSFATNISLLLIIIRLTNVAISLNSLAIVGGLIALNTILVKNILEASKVQEKTFSENMKNAYLKSIDAIIITLIIFAVFSFNTMSLISTAGLLLFWGWIIILLGNLAFTIPMLSMVNKK